MESWESNFQGEKKVKKGDSIVLEDSWQRVDIISDTWIVVINFSNIRDICKWFL